MARKNQNGHGMYRTMLLEKRRSVLSSLGIKSETLAALGRVAEEDQAPISHEEFVKSRVNTLEFAGLRLVNEALDRIESGDYGICLACEKPIPAKRLRALPWARYCVSCQERRNSMESEPEAEETARSTLIW